MSIETTAEQEILELGEDWARAELRGDTALLDALLDADFLCVGPRGFVINKEQYLAPRRCGDLRQAAFNWTDVSVRVYGDTAIAVGVQDQTTTYQGQDASGRFRVTQVLVRRPVGWVLASLQLSPIAPPPGAPAGSQTPGGR